MTLHFIVRFLPIDAHPSITPQMVQEFPRTARGRIRIDGGAYRGHLQALASASVTAAATGP
jgi:hypothetical protein